MKKNVLPLLVMLLAIASPASASSAQEKKAANGNSLIIYYSLSGNTKTVVEQLQNLIGADASEIKTVRPYPADFHAVVEQAREERRTNFLPLIQPIEADWRNYDTIYVGFPIWGNTIPQPMATFLSQNNLEGKTVIPFCTHDGYGVGRSFQVITEYCPKAKMLPGFDMLGSTARDAGQLLSAWLGRIGIKTISSQSSSEQIPITITIGDMVLPGILNDGPVARKFAEMLPMTVSMGQFGGREFYGSMPGRIPTDVEGRLRFDDGDITYCPQNNTVAIFYAQTDRPNLTMRVIPMGKVTSDLFAFHNMRRSVQMTFSLAE